MEQHLKERLVGAVVLTIAAVILIPIILTGSPSLELVSGLEHDAERSAAGVGLEPFSSKIVPLGSTTPLGLAAPEPASVRATTPVLPESIILAPRVADTQQSPTIAPARIPTKTAVAPAPTAKAAQSKGWLVQLGSFGNARNAASLKERLQKKAYRAFTRTSKTDNGEVTRVFVGPSDNRQQATQLAARLFAETRLKGMVVRQP